MNGRSTMSDYLYIYGATLFVLVLLGDAAGVTFEVLANCCI